jgi:hypothetical protein
VDALEGIHALRGDLVKFGINMDIVDFKYPSLVIMAETSMIQLHWQDTYWSCNYTISHDDTISAIVGICHAERK